MFSWHFSMGGSRNIPLWNKVEEGSRGAYKADNCVAGHLDPEVTLIKKNLWGSQLQRLSCTEMLGARIICCSVAVLCPTLQSHRLQHIRLPCPSLSPRVCSNSCPLSRWYQPSHPLLPASPPSLNLSQHQGLWKPASNFIPVLGKIGVTDPSSIRLQERLIVIMHLSANSETVE